MIFVFVVSFVIYLEVPGLCLYQGKKESINMYVYVQKVVQVVVVGLSCARRTAMLSNLLLVALLRLQGQVQLVLHALKKQMSEGCVHGRVNLQGFRQLGSIKLQDS